MKIVLGPVKALVIDLAREEYFHIDREVAVIILSLDNSFMSYDGEVYLLDNKCVTEIVDFTLKMEFGFLDMDPKNRFVEMSIPDYSKPQIINNSIIEFGGKTSKEDVIIFLTKIENAKCSHVEIRVYDDSLLCLSEIVDLVHEFDFYSISIKVNEGKISGEDYLIKLSKTKFKIGLIEIFNCAKINYENKEVFLLNILRYSEQLEGSHQCGAVKDSMFAVNFLAYNESINHNTCLNKKISLDRFGSVKLCPSLSWSIGSVDALNLDRLQDIDKVGLYYRLSKDQVDVCNICEYRNVCTDCRAYLENVDDLTSKPLKCGYDPFSGNWKDWNKVPHKLSAIDYYKREY